MGWFDWVFEGLAYFGLHYEEAKVLFLGLDNAGKTTLLNRLKDNSLKVHPPTFHPNQEDIIIGKYLLHANDLGGHHEARALWSDYYFKADAVIYLVDASDRERMGEARAELHHLLTELPNTPFLILGNKIDLVYQAYSGPQLENALGLPPLPSKDHPPVPGRRDIQLFMCSVANETGYKDGFEWLLQRI